MKPVFQEIVDNRIGDCWRCCAASILEVERDVVPNFVALANPKNGVNWADLAREWMSARGLAVLQMQVIPGRELYHHVNWFFIAGAHAIASVPSQAFPGGSHAVVVRWTARDDDTVGLDFVHDPNPANPPYPANTPISQLTFLVPVVPRIAQPSRYVDMRLHEQMDVCAVEWDRLQSRAEAAGVTDMAQTSAARAATFRFCADMVRNST